jgi:hypothetical protein
MVLKQFIQKENIQMLWDVISDEDVFKFLSPDIQSKIYNLFINNIQGFFEVEKTKPTTSLVEMNKKFILLILNHIRKTYPYQPSKIKIHNEPLIKELITYEEIHNDRKSQFDKDFTKKQEEFEDFMAIKTPPVPEFADPIGKTDRPIKEMDKILKDMQAQRNYEVERINKINNPNNNPNNNQVDNWLKPQETSLKSEKFQEIKPEESLNYSRFKFLNELEPNLSVTSPKKNVSFNNNDQINMFNTDPVSEDDEENNLFLKLKKVNKKEENITLQINEQLYNENKINGATISEDRITKLERNVLYLNEKIDKIIAILSNNNKQD